MTAPAASVIPAPSAVSTPSPGRRRRVLGWIAIGLVLVVVGVVGAALSGLGRWAQRDALDPESAGPTGTRAVAQLLRDRGVEVVVARDRASAHDALMRTEATLVLPDAPALSDAALEQLIDASIDVVLVQPRARTVSLVIPGTALAGVSAAGTVSPGCDLAEAERSGPIAPGTLVAAPPAAGSAPAIGCYPAGDTEGVYGLLVADDGDRRAAIVDGRVLFTNEQLAENGNAALALNLMGRHSTVVWYVPSLGDTDLANADPSLGELTPPWVTPVLVLLLAAGVAAAIWRGRRFGPLVAERLPVTVRVAETTEGRARLYAQSRATEHAADQLRVAALGRVARTLGLGPSAAARQIADAAAGVTGLDRGAVHGVLIDELPGTDGELVDLSLRLTHLEDAVRAAVRPEGNHR